MWKVGKLEIEMTIRSVCEEALTGDTPPKELKARRAKALSVLGDIFKRVGSAQSKGKESGPQIPM